MNTKVQKHLKSRVAATAFAIVAVLLTIALLPAIG